MIGAVPEWLGTWIATRRGARPASAQGTGTVLAPPAQAAAAVPDYVLARIGRGFATRSIGNLTESPPFSESEAARLFSALSALDAATDYSTWIRYGAALHDLKWIVNGTDEGFEIWDEWSATSKGLDGRHTYPGREKLESKWRSFDREYNGVRAGIASIFADARAAGWSYEGKQEKINGHNAQSALPKSFVDVCAAAPIHWVETDKAGNPKPTCRNARVALQHMGLACEYDAFHDKLIVGGQAIDVWAGEVTDNAVQMLRVMIDRQFHIDPGTTNTRDAAIQECLQGRFDPVCDYLDQLQWDGVPRLRQWLATYLGAEATTVNCAIGGLSLVAAVRRARVPGFKFDQITVLIGEEGRGKSQAIETLAGPDNFSDQTILTLDDRAQQEAIQGVWLYEIADLAGMSKADVEKVKAFASRRADRARPAYGRTRVDKPRRCVFFATTNHRTFLKAQTGNRRFWPVQTGRVDLHGLARDRDQLWAEAAAIESRAVPLLLPEALWSETARLQDERLDHDPWEDLLAAVTGKTKTPDGKLYMTGDGRQLEARILSQDLLDGALGLARDKMSDVTAKRVSNIMRRLGWDGPKVIRIGEARGRGYTKTVGTP